MQVLHRAVFERDGRDIQLFELCNLVLLIVPDDDRARVQLAELLHVDGEILSDKIRRGVFHLGRQRLQHGVRVCRLRRRVHARNARARAVHSVDDRCPRNRNDGETLHLGGQLHRAPRRIRHHALLVRYRLLLTAARKRERRAQDEQQRQQSACHRLYHGVPPFPTSAQPHSRRKSNTGRCCAPPHHCTPYILRDQTSRRA